MIGYYAHSHGSGHCNYANIFAAQLGERLVIYTDREFNFDSSVRVIKLPNENPDGTQFDRKIFKEPSSLHYAPVNIRKITNRNYTILKSIIDLNVSLLIIDVSVEIAMLARVSSIPYAYVRLQGNRNDAPHRYAFEGATFLLAYFPIEMESATTPIWVKQKTIYLGFISKYMFDSSPIVRPGAYASNGKPNLLYLAGFGGAKKIDFKSVEKTHNIYIVGPGSVCSQCSIGGYIGVVECTRAFIFHADSIIASCGSNTTSEILSLGKRFIAIPENRHYGEQYSMASGLQKIGWAIALVKNKSLIEALTELEFIKKWPSYQVNNNNLFIFCSILCSDNVRADRILNIYHEFVDNNDGRKLNRFKSEYSNIES